MDYWATPAGAVEAGESFEQAALRELADETGIRTEDPGPHVGASEFVLQMPGGEHVKAEERFFFLRVAQVTLSRDGWTAEEVQVMGDHRWWSRHELRQTEATVFPEDLAAMLDAALRG